MAHPTDRLSFRRFLRGVRFAPPVRAALVMLAACALLGCNSSGDGADCLDETTPTFASVPDTALRRSALRLERKRSFDLAGAETIESTVSLSLVDISKVRTDQRPPERLVGSETCVFLSGAPNTNQCRDPKDTPPCVPERLDADDVKIEGVPGGLTLEKQATGNYVNASAPSPLFDGRQLSISLTGKNDAAYFPSYTQTVAAPGPLDVTAPPKGVSVPLGDVQVKWSGGSGQYVEISLRTSRQGDTDAIVCVVRDDGCHTLPSVAFDRLLLGMAPEDNFELTVKRINVAVDAISADTAAEARAIERVVITLPQ